MIKYYKPVITKEGYTLSIDKVRLVFKFKSEKDAGVYDFNLLNNFKNKNRAALELFFNGGLVYGESAVRGEIDMSSYDIYPDKPEFLVDKYTHYGNKFGTYRFMYNIHPSECPSETITLAHCLNGNKKTALEGFIEFNPNKSHSLTLDWILKTLRLHCSYLMLKRYDIALDVPCRGDLITLHKDERKYEMCRPSSKSPEKDTEYLGQRNEVGRFKKYNKKEEHNRRACADEQINEEITRLELTLNSFDYTEFCRLFPCVERVKESTDLFDHMSYLEDYNSLSATDKVLVDLLSASPDKDEYFCRLGRDKKNKLKKLLYGHFHEQITVSEDDFNKCISQMKEYCHLFNTNSPLLIR